MATINKDSKSNLFQIDLIKNRYHIFDVNYAKVTGYYPEQLLEFVPKVESFNRDFKIEVGEMYSVRAFFALSAPVDGEVEYQSGYLDLKLMMQEKDVYIGEVVTQLPPMFALKKGSKIKISASNIFYKPDYSSIKNKA